MAWYRMGTSGTCVSAVQALDLAKKYMTLEDYDCAVVVGTDWMTSSMSSLYFQLLGAINPQVEVYLGTKVGTVL